MSKKDYYEILGIKKDADSKKIKSAYRALAKKYHPDMNPGNKTAEQKFKDISEAYDVLGNERKKKLYDKYGEMAVEANFDENILKKAESSYYGGNGPGGYRNAGYNSGYGGFYSGSYGGSKNTGNGYAQNGGWSENIRWDGDFSAEDLFSKLFGGMNFRGKAGNGQSAYGKSGSRFRSAGYDSGNGYSSYGGSGGRSGTYTYAYNDMPDMNYDADQYADISVSFSDAALGCEKVFMLGDGSKVKVKIPEGIGEGQSIRLRGKGSRTADGGRGDLMLKVHVLKDNFFERKDLDIYTTQSIPYTTAVLGGKAVFRTLKGNVECKIAPGTKPGSKIRLRKKGIVSMKDRNTVGDEYVSIQIAVPGSMTPEERKAAEKLKEAENKAR